MHVAIDGPSGLLVDPSLAFEILAGGAALHAVAVEPCLVFARLSEKACSMCIAALGSGLVLLTAFTYVRALRARGVLGVSSSASRVAATPP